MMEQDMGASAKADRAVVNGAASVSALRASVPSAGLVGELLEALELADATLRGANMNRAVVERKVAAAIARARVG